MSLLPVNTIRERVAVLFVEFRAHTTKQPVIPGEARNLPVLEIR